jgi:hypothetical protein
MRPLGELRSGAPDLPRQHALCQGTGMQRRKPEWGRWDSGDDAVGEGRSPLPGTPTDPAAYGEGVPCGVPTIAGVATSITAFVGRALRRTARGPADDPARVSW